MSELTVVGEEQQALGVLVEPANREHAGRGRHQLDDRGATLGIVCGRDDVDGLVEQVVDEPGSHADG